jgi:hypothetical protein
MPADIPAIPPPLGEGYRTTDYLGTCPECGQAVLCYYLVPAGEPGRTVALPGPMHADGCEHWRAEP